MLDGIFPSKSLFLTMMKDIEFVGVALVYTFTKDPCLHIGTIYSELAGEAKLTSIYLPHDLNKDTSHAALPQN